MSYTEYKSENFRISEFSHKICCSFFDKLNYYLLSMNMHEKKKKIESFKGRILEL